MRAFVIALGIALVIFCLILIVVANNVFLEGIKNGIKNAWCFRDLAIESILFANLVIFSALLMLLIALAIVAAIEVSKLNCQAC